MVGGPTFYNPAVIFRYNTEKVRIGDSRKFFRNYIFSSIHPQMAIVQTIYMKAPDKVVVTL